MPISIVVVLLLVIVTFSYRQTIRAYPNGGGSYIVAHANLGVLPGLVAAASLLTDYVLTVSVSVSAGRLQPGVRPAVAAPDARCPLIAVCILLVMVVNLRGLRESGTLFASPTYIFIGQHAAADRRGIVRTLIGERCRAPDVDAADRRRRSRRWACSCCAGLRRRLLGDDRHGGRGQRRACVQAGRVEERPDRPCS